jgi:uncharacterized protein YktA (UPF0223 family)
MIHIPKEINRKLEEELDQMPPVNEIFSDYLSNTIFLYENICKTVSIVSEDDIVPKEIQNLFYDKNTTLEQYIFIKRLFILDNLKEIKTLWNKKLTTKMLIVNYKMYEQIVSEVSTAIKQLEKAFPLLEKLLIINESSDVQLIGKCKNVLKEIRDDLINSGVIV